MVEIWNGLPGETPIRKFKDRATAVSRIWRAIQALRQTVLATEEPNPASETAPATEIPQTARVSEQQAGGSVTLEDVASESQAPTRITTVAPSAPDVVPEAAPETKKATRAKKMPAAAAKETGAPREGTKAAQVIAMLRRPEGATVEEIMQVMGWLKHATRALLSAGGSISKSHGLTVTSEKVGDKRVYSIKD